MARVARVKHDGGAFYHVCSRTAGPIGEYPLDHPKVRRRIVEFIRLFAKVYCCDVLGFCVMGNHYHLIVRMHEPKTLSRAELKRRASLLYSDKLLDAWLASKWDRFAERVFDVEGHQHDGHQRH